MNEYVVPSQQQPVNKRHIDVSQLISEKPGQEQSNMTGDVDKTGTNNELNFSLGIETNNIDGISPTNLSPFVVQSRSCSPLDNNFT